MSITLFDKLSADISQLFNSFDANPREYEGALAWATNEWPSLVADWKGDASSKLCAPRIKSMPGGLEKM